MTAEWADLEGRNATNGLKLLAFDLDGTLLNQRGHLSLENRRALDEARRSGLEITLVTGRHISKVLPFARELQLIAPIVTSNGCEVWLPEGELLHRSSLPQPEREWLHRFALEHELGYRAYCVEGVYDWLPGGELAESGHSGFEWLKVLLEDAAGKSAADAGALERGRTARCLRGPFDRLAADPRFALAAYSRDPARIDRIDVHPAGVDKAAGLSAVCRRLGVTAAEVAAFGDDTNDIAMLRWAGLGVAMEQAPPAVLEAADHVAPHHNRDGVAAFIRGLLAAK
ncbi:HAD family hydrolase [Paenibacillus sp. HJGM_3]|uniref:HAD family hydrolase n=1 Tax=Paenibacillus sp. HJGM_3 TaxID=3379816 RepID=UPI003859AAFD